MSCDAGHCITCSDEGVEMRVLAVDTRRDMVLCADLSGTHHTVDAGILEPLAPGDVVLVHAGVALVQIQGAAA